ncbi:hypothetical protein BGZ80_006379 [Entomortierella chlamydospora]|uniref:3CxxC-type domain-containing protein n=1 Tax=Entomortierella chlamydospora TaxID=101097 RepID=A0A9P6STQ8_9FUNG|nr:hypothetical protein BGZ80_006379 [Entomortierella chlamydospora]
MEWIYSIVDKLTEPFRDKIEGSERIPSHETRATGGPANGIPYHHHKPLHHLQQGLRPQESNMAASTVLAVPAVLTGSDLPKVATHQVADAFYLKLLDLNTPDLYQLKIGDYPKWAKDLLHVERRRRKKNKGKYCRLTKIDREEIISTYMASLSLPSETTAPSKQESTTINVEEPNFYSTKWTEDASDNVVVKFNHGLAAMSSVDLGRLSISNYPKWARKEIHRERCHRKNQTGAVGQPSNKDQKRAIPIGMDQPSPQENSISPATKKPNPQEEMKVDFSLKASTSKATYPSGTITSSKQASTTINVEEPDFYSTKWPEDASDNVIMKFSHGLDAMSSVDLGKLYPNKYPKWARREIDRERFERKNQASAVDQPSDKDQKKAIPVEICQPSPQKNDVSPDAKESSPREEMEADFLHNALTSKATYSLIYDKSIADRTVSRRSKYGPRSMYGIFNCRGTCWHRWRSGKVAAELWLRVDTGRYRVVLHSQRCQKCDRYAEPEIEVEAYVLKVIRAFDLWKGLRDFEEGDPHHKSAAPHDYDRCHGCEKGVCSRLFELLRSLNSLPYSPEAKGTSYAMLSRLLNTKPHVFTPYPDLLRFLKNRDASQARG